MELINQEIGDAEILGRIGSALARAISLQEMGELMVKEFQTALHADAVCVYLAKDSESFFLLAEHGCSEEFKTKWKVFPRALLPLTSPANTKGGLFVGSPDETKSEVRELSDLIDKSGKKMIAYAPLMVDHTTIGMFGFSYNTWSNRQIRRKFVAKLIDLGALALDRAALREKEVAAGLASEAANRAKTEFLTNMSHEIRTPVAAIHGFADLLVHSEGLSDDQRKWATVICRNAKLLTFLIGDVLDISRIEADRLELDSIAFSPAELVEEIKTMAALRAEEKEIAIKVTCDKLPNYVCSDLNRIRQILLNLIGNAVKFTMTGEIRIHTRSFGTRLEFTVEDTGIGIAAENRERIFEPFIQADNSTRRLFGGTGLGLAISKRLARVLGGDLQLIDSSLGKGSKFLFTLECEPVHSGDGKSASTDGARPLGSEDLVGCSILVIDDCLDNQDLLHWMLSKAGAQVDVAASGKNGIEMALKTSYGVILMDIQMPEIDGHEATARLRAKGYTRPIVALTAHALSNERERCLREGFDEYLTKPIDLRALALTIKDLCRRS